MPLSGPGQRFPLALWRWSSKIPCEQRAEVHYTPTSSRPHFVSRETEEYKNSKKVETTFHSVHPQHMNSFLKHSSSKVKMNRVQNFPAAAKILPVPKRDSLVWFTFHDSSSILGPSVILSKSKDSWLLPGSRLSILVAHTHLLSATEDHLHWVVVHSLHSCYLFGLKKKKKCSYVKKRPPGTEGWEWTVTRGGRPSETELTLCLATTRCQQLIWFQFFSKGEGNPWWREWQPLADISFF